MNKNIMIVQSRDTGRFLFKKVDGCWTFPSVVDNDPSKAVVYEAMADLGQALNQDVQENDWLLDYVSDPVHQVFHVWVHGEPTGEGELTWEYMFSFPYDMADITEILFQNIELLEKSLGPGSL